MPQATEIYRIKTAEEEFIPLSVPCIRGNEWDYIKDCLESSWVSSEGSYVERFERDIIRLTGARHAVACINGTSALHLALRLSGVRAGDEVIVPALTFIAPVNTVRYLGAEPVFMDCDDFYNIDAEKTVQFLEDETVFRQGQTKNRKTGRRISAIIPVHVFGNAADLYKIIPMCKKRNIKIIEDATESLGACYSEGELKGKHTGTVGDIGCYSFNANKIITTGGGGMVVTNNPCYASEARYLTTQAKDDPVKYVHNHVGFNLRLTNIPAALGVAQLERLPEYIRIKKKNYMLYKREIEKMPGLSIADTPDYAESNHWFYPLRIDMAKDRAGRDELMGYLSENRIQARPIWRLNHLQKPYKGCQAYKIKNALTLYEKTLNIPCSVGLKDAHIKKVLDTLRRWTR